MHLGGASLSCEYKSMFAASCLCQIETTPNRKTKDAMQETRSIHPPSGLIPLCTQARRQKPCDALSVGSSSEYALPLCHLRVVLFRPDSGGMLFSDLVSFRGVIVKGPFYYYCQTLKPAGASQQPVVSALPVYMGLTMKG